MALSILKRLSLALIVLLALAACGPADSGAPDTTGNTTNTDSEELPPQPTLPPLEEGKGAISGTIVNQNGAIGPGVRVYLAPHTRHPEGWGVYVLDTSTAASTLIDVSGFFQVANVEPGEYVLVIGAQPENAVVVEQDGEARVFEVLPNEVLDTGNHTLAIPSVSPVSDDTPAPYPAPERDENQNSPYP